MPKPHPLLSRRWLLIAAIALLMIAVFTGWHSRLKRPAVHASTKAPAPTWQATQLQPGDSVARVFQKYKIPAATLQEILKLKSAQKNLAHLRQGDEVAIKRDQAGNLLALRIPLNKKEWLVINRFKEQFASSRIDSPPPHSLQASARHRNHVPITRLLQTKITQSLTDSIRTNFQLGGELQARRTPRRTFRPPL